MHNFQAYPSFAEFLGSDPELSVYRRFDRLSSRNLLYLQSELLELQAHLEEFDQEDYKDKSGDIILSARCWGKFAQRSEEYPRENERMVIIRKIRVVMKEYREGVAAPTIRGADIDRKGSSTT